MTATHVCLLQSVALTYMRTQLHPVRTEAHGQFRPCSGFNILAYTFSYSFSIPNTNMYPTRLFQLTLASLSKCHAMKASPTLLPRRYMEVSSAGQTGESGRGSRGGCFEYIEVE